MGVRGTPGRWMPGIPTPSSWHPGMSPDVARSTDFEYRPNVRVHKDRSCVPIKSLKYSKGKREIWHQCGFLLPGMIKQFLRDVDWGEVDYLIVDTPPGTSDEHLSVIQYLAAAHIDGAVVITTPQVSKCPEGARPKPRHLESSLLHRALRPWSPGGSVETSFIFGPGIFH